MKSLGLSLAALLLLSGCAGDDDDSDPERSGPLCTTPDEFVLQGRLDGSEVYAHGAITNPGWDNGNRVFRPGFEGGGQLIASFPEVVADGESTTISGTIALPPEIRGGETLSFGAGTLHKLDEGADFELYELSVVVTCVTEPCPNDSVVGELRGCVYWGP